MKDNDLVAKINRQLIEEPYVTFYYPQVEGLDNVYVQEEINERILEQVEELILSQQVNDDDAIVEITGDYMVKLNRQGLLSIRYEIYSYREHAAHGMTVAKSQTFDLNNGRLYQLHDFFISGSGYVQFINQEIKRQIVEKDVPLINNFVSISRNQDFYLYDIFLIIYFQLYEYTPYVYGFPQFEIPIASLRPYIRPGSPLTRLLPDR